MNFTGKYENTFSYRSYCCEADGQTNKCCPIMSVNSPKQIPNMNTPESGALSPGKSIGRWLTVVVGMLSWLVIGKV